MDTTGRKAIDQLCSELCLAVCGGVHDITSVCFLSQTANLGTVSNYLPNCASSFYGTRALIL